MSPTTLREPTTFEGPHLDAWPGIGALTLGGFLGEVAERFGPAEAVVFDDPLRDGATVRWTYHDLAAEAHLLARALVSAGVERGDVVAVLMGNRPEALAAIFAAALVGAVAAPLSTFAPPPELHHLLDASRASVVLTQSRLLGRRFGDDLVELAPRLAALRRVAVLGEASWAELSAAADTVERSAVDRRAAAVSPDDPALVIFTSGTTRDPKGILHGHRSPSLQFWLQAQLFGRHPHTRMYSALPIFWTAGLNTAVGSTLAAGGCWVAQETFEPAGALALMARERVTEPYTLAHQTAALAEHPDWTRTDLSSVRCAYGKGAYARHPSVRPDPGWIMPVGYGLSETCAFVAGYRSDDTRDQVRIGAGRLLPGVRVRVVDPEHGGALGVGEEGELAVAGATLMLGYLGRSAADTFDADGFFHTGDAGHVDGEGILHYAGRRTEMIKTGGANVSPAELEVALRACPGVKLSRVVGIDDPRLGQVVVACVVRRRGAALTGADVQAFLRGRVSAYKVPRHVLFFAPDELPLTHSGAKVRDDDLLALVRRRLAGPDAAPDPGVTDG